MTPQELKASILQLAIQGKLVEQRAEEGTAEELYQQIRADKLVRLKGKSEAKLSAEHITEDEILFEIPETWKWVRFGHIMINRDAERIPLSVDERSHLAKKYDYYGASGVIDKVDRFLFDKTLLLIGEDGANLLLRSTPIAYLAHGQYWVNNHAHVLDCNESLVYMKYIMYFVNAINLAKYVTGTAQPKMNQEKMNSIPIALPPLAEQKRIVAKIEELLPYIDRYEQAWSRLEDFNRRFPVDMQKSILQMAIQGKLVEQRPEEGTGEELYQQIQQEKQRLIKAGTIKKEKPLPEIMEDEIPFDIPEGWKWVRLQNLCSLIGDIDHNMPKAVPANEGVAFLSAKDLLDDGSINYTENVKYISYTDFERLSRKAKPQLNDIIYSRIGACLGKARVVETDITFLVSYSCCVIRPITIDVHYLRYYLESPLIMAHSIKARQSIGVPDLGMGEIKKYLVALPPLAEQKRIVAKLEEILPLCDRLK